MTSAQAPFDDALERPARRQFERAVVTWAQPMLLEGGTSHGAGASRTDHDKGRVVS